MQCRQFEDIILVKTILPIIFLVLIAYFALAVAAGRSEPTAEKSRFLNKFTT